MSTSADIHDLEEGLRLRPKFDAAGLVTCVTTDAATGDVLMVAHMNDEALRRTMEKIHRGIDIEVSAPATAKFRGERQDFEEMVGNLVDNACKWAKAQVSIRVDVRTAADPEQQAMLHIVVDDDGKGLSPDGKRLDESKPGSGLGLSIVVDLAALYGGRLTLDAAPPGGLRAELILPAA